MKRFYLKFRIGLITFVLGLACVFMFQGSLYSNEIYVDLLYSNEIYVDLPEVKSDNVIEITPIDGMFFSLSAQACNFINEYGGRGSGSSYESSYYNQYVYRESSCHKKTSDTEEELNLRISKAKKVLEFNDKSNQNKRFVLEMEERDKWIDILKYDSEKGCITIISAPSLKPALEFEKFWNSKFSK